MRILMFPERNYPCDHAMLESIYARILPARGHDVHWIMRAADHDPSTPTRPWHGSTVHTVPLAEGSELVNSRSAVAATLASSRMFATTGGQYDIVQVRNEMGPSLAALWHRQRAGFSFVYQMSFPSAEYRLANMAEGLARPAWYHWARAHAELSARRRVLRRADAVLAISDTMREELLLDRKLSPDRVVTFPLGYDETSEPDAAPSRRGELGFGCRPLAVYFGTLSGARRLGFLARTLVAAQRVLPGVALIVIGGDGDQQQLAASFAEAGVASSVRLLGRLSRRETMRWVAAADVSLVPMPPSPVLVSTSPTKLMESLGLGVPVVGNREVPEIARVLEASGGGLAVPYDPDAFAAALVELLRDDTRRLTYARAGREWIRRHRSYEVLATQVEGLYGRLRSQGTSR